MQTGYSPGGVELLAQLKQHVVARTLVYCEPEWIRLMESSDGVDVALSKVGPAPLNPCDYHSPMMSLLLLFQTRLEGDTATM